MKDYKQGVPVLSNSLVEGMKNRYWGKTRAELEKEQRLAYLKKNHKPLSSKCPECGNDLTPTEDEDEIYCTHCGLITSMSIEYVAGMKIDLPYGRH
jgi:ribosomal protein S27AE